MSAPRLVQLSTRRILAIQRSPLALTKQATPAIATHKPFISSRPVTTQTVKDTTAYSILEQQRRNRPISPHLSIYKPQISWYLSGLNRITGSVLSGGFYIFGFAYLCSPLFGWHLDSASIAAAFGAWPVAAKVLVKMGIAMPFTFHSFNGIRHLIWDTGAALTNKQVVRTGWTVVGLTFASSAALAMI